MKRSTLNFALEARQRLRSTCGQRLPYRSVQQRAFPSSQKVLLASTLLGPARALSTPL